jgi:hypothetical protein
MMNELELENLVATFLREQLPSDVDIRKRAPIRYAAGARSGQQFKVDILVCDGSQDGTPRVAIELKAKGINTHDLLAYSAKASLHRSLRGFLRYGLFVCGDASHGVTAKWLWHGRAFDFMMCCRNDAPSADEMKTLRNLVLHELKVARRLEELINQAGGPWPSLVWWKAEID